MDSYRVDPASLNPGRFVSTNKCGYTARTGPVFRRSYAFPAGVGRKFLKNFAHTRIHLLFRPNRIRLRTEISAEFVGRIQVIGPCLILIATVLFRNTGFLRFFFFGTPRCEVIRWFHFSFWRIFVRGMIVCSSSVSSIRDTWTNTFYNAHKKIKFEIKWIRKFAGFMKLNEVIAEVETTSSNRNILEINVSCCKVSWLFRQVYLNVYGTHMKLNGTFGIWSSLGLLLH